MATWRQKLWGVASGSEGECGLGESEPHETSASIQWALALQSDIHLPGSNNCTASGRVCLGAWHLVLDSILALKGTKKSTRTFQHSKRPLPTSPFQQSLQNWGHFCNFP